MATVFDRLAKAVDAFRDADDDKRPDAAQEDDDAPDASQMQALLRRVLPEPTEEKPRSLFHDPYAVLDWGGWREKPTSINFETLRQMAMQCGPIASIIQLRTDQIAAFAKPQQGKWDKGYRVMLRDRRDQKRAMSKVEAAQAAEIERMLETTGVLLPHEHASDRDSFRDFVKKFVRDTLTYDQSVFEKIRDKRGKVSRFIMIPSETIRPAVADIEHISAEEMHDRVSHVQVFEDTVIAEYSPDDLAWCVKNPRSDLRVNTFGFSPVEQVTNLVTAWLFGFTYNQKIFTNGASIPGIINIKGAIPDRQLKSFRRMWYSMVAGISNAFRTPILNSEDIQWIPMQNTNREMEFAAWMDWLTKMICSVFEIDPLEINFIFGNSGQKSALSASRPNADEVTESKDKGLMPLAEFIEDNINAHIVWDLNPDFEFCFAGLNAKEEKQQRDAWIAEAKSHKTVNEVRAEQDMDPLPKGDIILDSVWAQVTQGGGEGGGGGEEPGGGPLEDLKPGHEEDDADDEENDDDEQEQDEGGDDFEPYEKPEPAQFESRKVAKSVDAALARLALATGIEREVLRKAKGSRRAAAGRR